MAGVTGRLALSVDDAELCLDNARGLQRDSKKTSDETALALLELSMEECAKGIILTLDRVFAAAEFDPNSEDSLSKISDAELRALYQRHAKSLSPLAVRRAFESHAVKLRQLQFVLDLMSYHARHGMAGVAIREAFSHPEYPLGHVIRLALIPPKKREAALTQAMQGAFQKINDLGVATLDQRKNDALYVALAEDEQSCSFPEVDAEFLSQVRESCEYLLQILEGMILSSRATRTRGTRSALRAKTYE